MDGLIIVAAVSRTILCFLRSFAFYDSISSDLLDAKMQSVAEQFCT